MVITHTKDLFFGTLYEVQQGKKDDSDTLRFGFFFKKNG